MTTISQKWLNELPCLSPGTQNYRGRYHATHPVHAHYSTLSLLERRLKGRQALSLEIMKNHVLCGEQEKSIKLFLRYSG